jgi:hypothetical protein
VATLLIYLSDVKDDAVTTEDNMQCKGGATNFPIAQLPASSIGAFNNDPTSGVTYLGRRTSEKFFDYGSASEKEKLGCYSGMSVRPKRGDAILFYNLQTLADGSLDIDWDAIHAGCDVTEGEKWVGNVW